MHILIRCVQCFSMLERTLAFEYKYTHASTCRRNMRSISRSCRCRVRVICDVRCVMCDASSQHRRRFRRFTIRWCTLSECDAWVSVISGCRGVYSKVFVGTLRTRAHTLRKMHRHVSQASQSTYEFQYSVTTRRRFCWCIEL